MEKLTRKESGTLAENLVFYKLNSLGYPVSIMKDNNEGYDLEIINGPKIEVKHIRREGDSSRDSFVLKKAQVPKGAFDYLVLLVSERTNKFNTITFNFYVFAQNEISKMKPSNLKDYTYNLSNDGKKIASHSLNLYHNKWCTIRQ